MLGEGQTAEQLPHAPTGSGCFQQVSVKNWPSFVLASSFHSMKVISVTCKLISVTPKTTSVTLKQMISVTPESEQ